MNILEALARLRDDIKIWVTNNLNSLNNSQNAALTALENSLDGKISKAIDEEGFSGNYDDLTNAPIMNDENGNFIITDEQNNKILEINKDGLYTTNVFSDGVNLKSTIENNQAEQNAKNAELDKKIQDININIDNLPLQDLDGENFIVADNKNNKILQVDKDGLRTTKIFFKPEADKSEIDLYEALKRADTYTDAKVKEVQDDLDEHKAAYVAKVSVLEKADEDLNDAIDDVNDRIDNIPLKEDLNNENRFVIVDDKAQNILADFNNDGLRVKNVIINGDNNSTINVKAKIEGLDAVDNSLQEQLSTLKGNDTNKSVRTIAQEETAKIVDNAPEKFNTLKEIADWISNDTTGAAGIASGLLDVRKEVYGTSNGTSKDPSRIDSAEATLAAATGDITTLNNAIGDLTANSVDTRISNAKTELTGKINDAEARAKKYTDDEVAEHAAEVSAAFEALPFQDLNSEESKSFIIADNNNNKIAEFDKDGLRVLDIYFKKDDNFVQLSTLINLVVDAELDGNYINLINSNFNDIKSALDIGKTVVLNVQAMGFAKYVYHKDNEIIFRNEDNNVEYKLTPSNATRGDWYNTIEFNNKKTGVQEGQFLQYVGGATDTAWVTIPNATTTEDGFMSQEDKKALASHKTKLEKIAPSIVLNATAGENSTLIFLDNDFNPIQLNVTQLSYYNSHASNITIRLLNFENLDLCYAYVASYDESIFTFKFETDTTSNGKSYVITGIIEPTSGNINATYEEKVFNIADVVYHGETNEGEGTLPPEIALEDLMPKAGGRFTGAVEYTTFAGGNITSSGIITANQVYGAVWNDYAEFRQATEDVEPGHAVCENGDDTVTLSTKRMQPGAMMVSDTYGFAIGETDKCKCPIAVAGRVLMYPYEKREKYKPGDAVCSGPNGTVSKMSRLETILFPDRILGTVSSIPNYEFWGEKNIEVKNRIWIKVI